MKSCLTLAGIVLVAASVSAAPVQTLIENNDDWSFWIKPEFKLTQLGGQGAIMPGIQFGPALGHTLYFGLGGYALVNSVEASNLYKDLKAFDFWYSGVSMNYTLFYWSLVHGSVGCLLGYGQLNADSLLEGSDRADLFVVDPGINVMLNLTSSLELGVGGTYRIVNGSNFDDLSNSDLGGLTGSIFLRWTEE